MEGGVELSAGGVGAAGAGAGAELSAVGAGAAEASGACATGASSFFFLKKLNSPMLLPFS